MKISIDLGKGMHEAEIDGYQLLDNKVLTYTLLNGDIVYVKDYVSFAIQDAHIELFAVFSDVGAEPMQLTEWLTKEEAILFQHNYKKEHIDEHPYILITRRGL